MKKLFPFLGVLTILVAISIFLGLSNEVKTTKTSKVSKNNITTHKKDFEKEKQFFTNKEYVKMLGIGINVNWMTFNKVNHYYFYWRKKGVNICELFKKRGFDSVRVRVNSNVIFNESKMKELKEIVQDCLKANETIVIAYSASEYLNNPKNKSAQELFLKFWHKMANEFNNYPYLLSFDLIIEPGKEAKNYPNLTVSLMKKAFMEIRSMDKERIIIVPAPQASKPYSLNYLINFPFDNYSIIEWHIYAGGPCKKAKKIYYNNASNYFYFNKSFIEESFKRAKSFTNKTKIPTWLGAIRLNCYPKNPKLVKRLSDGAPKGYYESKKVIEFALFICNESKKYKIPFSLNADTKFFDFEKLKWYESQSLILNKLFNCLKRESSPWNSTTS